ncbi:MAG TPA: DUF433 domain-containing protein [Bryobacteraceae bacterium]|nr:DUF433 domain-containing protein [Bryobacteraceae bacterium]
MPDYLTQADVAGVIHAGGRFANSQMTKRFTRITEPDTGPRACIRGMRITVSLVVNLVANGMSPEDIVPKGLIRLPDPDIVAKAAQEPRVVLSQSRKARQENRSTVKSSFQPGAHPGRHPAQSPMVAAMISRSTWISETSSP